LQSLLRRRSVLVRLVFPHELPRSSARPRILLAPVSTGGEQVEARFISESHQGSTVLPGNTYFYLVDGAELRAGTRVVASVTIGDEKRDGIVVPNDAVVWHAGKAWVYIAQDPATFGRYEISTTNELFDGWFQSGSLKPGDEVVVSGAQLLLSEELKFQIRNENED
jgi:multidrug efflux pump subunit AcrA (membrane-fusion protein)